ncbi:cysteine hydrolase [Paenibacillus aurantius]|uniref:Cysteine hydrolase n=1 Tax=Paenibacillus aurantius TaxID=2918900 RepID=A0AA96RF09_9BACL|nr:cysteine hydrolase [Paenibacillus aurantius]WNQ10991.1 cysteine hydrolase [Paenibacillus aurantius]
MTSGLRCTALLVMDLQNGIVSRFVSKPELLLPFKQAIEAARVHGVPVIYVRVAFREGYPEVSPNNKSFAAITQVGGMTESDEATQIYSAVQPQPGELLVTKRRVSAFTGSDLEAILRARGIDTLVLTGIATSGVVLSTLREAADKDFALQVLSDACLDADPEVHRVLMEKVFPRQADVMTAEAWIASLNEGNG